MGVIAGFIQRFICWTDCTDSMNDRGLFTVRKSMDFDIVRIHKL